MDIAALGDEDMVLGLKLAGVTDAAVFSPESIEESIEKVGGAKILVMTEQVATYLREQDLMRKVTAVVAEIPSKEGSTGAALENISRQLEAAIGVKLK